MIEREVRPYMPDAAIDHGRTRIGYEIPFTRIFHSYAPPRPLDEIDAEISTLQTRIEALLEDVQR